MAQKKKQKITFNVILIEIDKDMCVSCEMIHFIIIIITHTMSKCKSIQDVHGSRSVADWFLGYSLTRISKSFLKLKLIRSSIR